jgi:signal transduction histidine kinase
MAASRFDVKRASLLDRAPFVTPALSTPPTLPAAASDTAEAPGSPRSRLGAGRSLRLSLVVLVIVAALITALESLVLANLRHQFLADIILYCTVGFAYIVVGAVLWERRPANRVGFLLCIAGIVILIASSDNIEVSFYARYAALLGTAPEAVIVHALLAYPSGRLRSRSARVVALTMYFVQVVIEIPAVIVTPPPDGFAGRVVHPHLAFVNFVNRWQLYSVSAILLVVAWLMWRRLRQLSARSGERRPLLLVYGYGVLSLSTIPLVVLWGPHLRLDIQVVFLIQVIVLLVFPFVLGAGILFGGLARTAAIEELGAWLAADTHRRPSLREALATTLGDASVQMYFASREPDVLVDGGGRPVDLSHLEVGRASTVIVGSEGISGVVVYDADLIADPAIVESACSVVALAIERERLTAALLASGQALRESRSRIVEVGDQERRRVAQDLHDILQGQLVVAALHAGQVAAAVSADDRTQKIAEKLRDELSATITTLRRQLHGLMPALLIERGLSDAVAELVDRLPLRTNLQVAADLDPLPPTVASTAYFILSEALTNVVKHAHADLISIQLTRSVDLLNVYLEDDGIGGARPTGAGLTGIVDRVDALGGSVKIDSPRCGGTRIFVTLPTT